MTKILTKRIVWIMFLLVSIFLFSVSLVYSESIETSTYRIECTPDVATIQARGFAQTCSYTLKAGSYTGDVAFCFDTPLKYGKVFYHLLNGSLSDITAQFNFHKFNIVKGYCYYIPSISWTAGDNKIIDLVYMPLDVIASPKWDTYFGDIATHRIDLALDPVYNISLYEIGSSRSSAYYWEWASGSRGVIQDNTDISNTNASFCIDRAGNVNCTRYYYKAPESPSFNGGGAWTEEWSTPIDMYRNVSYVEYVTNTTNAISASGTRSRLMLVHFYMDGTNTTDLDGCLSGGPVRHTHWTISDVSQQLNRTAFFMCMGDSPCGCTGTTVSSNNINVTMWESSWYMLGKNSSVIESVNITLPIMASGFKLNPVYSGTAFINISFDNLHYYYMSLSNTTRITFSDLLTDNYILNYKLYLLTNETYINNLSIEMTGYTYNINFSVRNEATGLVISNQTTVMTVYDGTSFNTYNLANGTGNITYYGIANLTLQFSTAGYGVRSQVYEVTPNINQLVIQYLAANCTATLMNYYTSSSLPISNVFGQMFGYVNSSLVLLESHNSDVTGKSQFCTLSSTYYYFNNSKSGYADYPFALNPVLFSSYTIVMTSTAGRTVTPTASAYYSPNIFRQNALGSFNITFLSPFNSFINYSYNLSYSTGSIIGLGTDSYGETLTDNYNLTGVFPNDIVTLYYEWYLDDGSYQNFTQTFRVQYPLSNRTLANLGTEQYGFLAGDRTLIVTFIALILGGVAWLGTGSILIALLGSGIIFSTFASNNFFPVILVYVVVTLGVFIVFARGQQSG